jgi:general secretion pathway protein N
MKRATLATGLLIGVATLLFLPLRLPAALLGTLLTSQTDGRLSLAATEGTIWHGSAQPLLGGEALAERMAWDIQPAELLHGRLVYQLALDDGSARLSLGAGGTAISNVNLSVPAAPLFKLDERTRGYALTGQLHLVSPSLRWAKGQPDGAMQLDWRGAGSSLAPALNPLGDYQLTATPAGDGWHLQFNTLAGSLQINGAGDWQASRGLNVDVGLKAAPGTEASLTALLSRMGPGAPNAERRLRFNFR